MLDLVGIQEFLEHLSSETLTKIYMEAQADLSASEGNLSIIRKARWLQATIGQILASRDLLPV